MLDSPKPYKPNTLLADLINIEVLEADCAQRIVGDPYWEVLLEVKKQVSDGIYTIDNARNHLETLKVIVCGAVHENTRVCEFGVANCPIREKNIACLHGLDFFDQVSDCLDNLGVNTSSMTWALKTFSLAYVLQTHGYKAPNFLDDYAQWAKRLDKYDFEASKLFKISQDEISLEDKALKARAITTTVAIKKFQRSLEYQFKKKYVIPTRAAFTAFWNEKVEADPI